MAFEDRMEEMKNTIPKKTRVIETQILPRISKSYTLKKELAEELATRANEQELTASRYLENILKKEFKIK